MYVQKRDSRINIRISQSDKNKAQKHCNNLDVSINDYIVKLIQNNLEKNGISIEPMDKPHIYFKCDVEDMPL